MTPQQTTIVLATTNKGKLAELNQMFAPLNIHVSGLDDFDPVPPAVEDADTFEENARKKALHYAHLLNARVLADDSGLEIDALCGRPGVQSARFANADHLSPADRDRANNDKVLTLLAETPLEKRTARFRCCLCLADPDRVLIEVTGSCEGLIIDTPKGANGFGYDPLFYLPDRDKTIAQLPPHEKNQISHRGNALKKLIQEMKITPTP